MQAECKNNFEVKKLTTFKIGGIVKKAYFPKTSDEFVSLLNNLDEYLVLGNCSNLLISSQGYDGNIIFTTKIKDYKFNNTSVTASCGVKGQLLSKLACENSLSGFEFMIGFPGTVGGEVYMNASAHGQCISDNLTKCILYDKESKNIIYKNKNELNFGYRYSFLQENKYILLSAEFELIHKPITEIQEIMNNNLNFRRNVQPSLAYPNAGSVFRNPQDNSAGKLLEMSGAKTFEDDNVKVWDKHANFIINKGNATSLDILKMMVKMKSAVEDNFMISLKPEIVFIGNMTKEEEELCKILYQKIQK
ncbi:MAG: UDP-N-acetylmuramate dehydrogenase [bacterium]|nr:UDP-N-acetylmuramate dehydrogenase [bacterium]